jgi:hypothetical protein
MRNNQPIPLIQNHISWCWAVCARLLGERYAKRRSTSVLNLTSLENAYPFGIPVDDTHGFRSEYLGRADGAPTADLWQWAIVHASGAGKMGTATDGIKERAVRFVITGEPENERVKVNTYGKFGSGVSVHPFFNDILCKNNGQDIGFIGNCFLPASVVFHSIFADGNRRALQIYDPWDGASFSVDTEQLFASGVKLSLGQAVAEWIQYVI